MNIKIILLLFLLSFIAYPLKAYNTDIIVNKINPVNELSVNEAYLIMTLRMRSWETGEQIKIFTYQSDSYAHKEFLFDMFGIGRSRYERIISARGKKYQYKIYEVNTPSDMINSIKNNIGAIGYINGRLLANLGGESVKIVKITNYNDF